MIVGVPPQELDRTGSVASSAATEKRLFVKVKGVAALALIFSTL